MIGVWLFAMPAHLPGEVKNCLSLVAVYRSEIAGGCAGLHVVDEMYDCAQQVAHQLVLAWLEYTCFGCLSRINCEELTGEELDALAQFLG